MASPYFYCKEITLAELQDTVLNAVSTMIDNAISALKVDKTITATVISCNNAVTGEYILSYNGGRITAYVTNTATSYTKNQIVHVLVPSGELSARKTIIGVAANIGSDSNLTSTAALIDNYNLLGSNLVSASGTGFYPKGVQSGGPYGNRALVLYDASETTTDQLRYSESIAKNNLEQAEKLLIQASFRTNLSSQHQYESKGEYSLTVGVALKDNTYTRNKYDVIASKSTYGDTYFTDACATFRTELNAIIKNVNGFTESEAYWKNVERVYYNFFSVAQNIVNLDPECGLIYDGDITTTSSTYDMNSGAFPTPKRVNIQKIGTSNFFNILDIAEGQKVDGEVIKYCTLSSTDMIGDPKSFYSYSPQYNLYDLDAENFIRIDSVTFSCDGFTTEDYPKDDIFIKDVKIYFLKEISAINGDFKLKISQSDGNVFTSQSSVEQLPVELKLLYKNNVVNSEANFYWYKKNSLVTKDSLDYEYHGGTGWSYLGTKYTAATCYFLASDNLAYKNEYKVVAVHDATTTLSDTFILYNESAEKEVTIESDLGDTFYFDEQNPVLTCTVLPEVSGSDVVKYVWNKTDDNYQTRTDYTKSADELTAERDAALDKNKQENNGAGATAITRTYASQIEDASKITFLTTDDKGKQVANSQKVQYSLRDITSTTITLGCTVFILPDGVEANQYEIGSGSITLTNKKKGSSVDYNIIIDNGSQFFQYTESGVSPAANSQGEDAIEVKALGCKFYSPNGMEMATGAYTVRWEIPTSNTLITMSEDVVLDTETFAEYNDTRYIYKGYTLTFGIADTYNYSYTNNQIRCVVTYEGEEYYKYTNLTFLKVGENGTNGTDVSVKILPAVAASSNSGYIDNVAKGIEPLCAVCDIYPQSGVEAYYHLRWNSGQSFSENVVQAQVFQKNEQIEEKNITSWTWSVAGNDSKNRMTLNSYTETNGDKQENPSNKRGVFNLAPATANTNSLIIKACAEMEKEVTSTTTTTTDDENKTAAEKLAEDVEQAKEKKSYYAFLPIPIIAYSNNGTKENTDTERNGVTPYTSPIRVAIDKQETLQSILYDASGLNPQYDTNKGVTLNIYPNYSTSVPSGYSNWTDYLNAIEIQFLCVGGEQYNSGINYGDSAAVTAGFWVSTTQDEERIPGITKGVTISGGGAIGTDYPYLIKKVYVRPNDNYSGKYTNNAVIARIVRRISPTSVENLAHVEIPIHLSLNTHTLASLNAWDGNSVQINEDDEYILAPQIGAGYKTEVTDGDDLNNTTNVFTGIVMGTKEENGKTKAGLYGYNLGRQCIELDAETGSAIFGLAESAASAENGWQNGRIELIPDGESKIGNWVIGSNSLYNIKWTRDFTDSNTAPTLAGDGEVPFEMMETNNLTNAEYKNVLGSKTSGILISSDPSFFSAKGATLADKNDNPLDFDSGSSEVSPGDSLEIAIDPNQNSIFTMYQHTNTADYANVEADQPFISHVTGSDSVEYWYIVKRSLGENSQHISNGQNSYTTQEFENTYANQIYTKVCVKHFDKTNNTYDNSDNIQWFEFFNPINTDNGINQYYIATLRTIQDEDSTSGRIYEYTYSDEEKKIFDNYIRRDTFRIRTVNGLDSIKKNLQNVAAGTESKKTDWKYSDLKNDLVWRKLPRVGIESNGRFYTNALKDQSTSMSMGKVMAFGHKIDDAKYFGTNFEISNLSDSESKQYFKIFIPKSSTVQNEDYFDIEDNPVILSGGYDSDDEFVRPMEIYGKTLKMYAGSNAKFAKMRHNEYTLSLGENNNSRFGCMKLEDDTKVVKPEINNDTTVSTYDTVTWTPEKLHTNSAFLDLYSEQTQQATIKQSNGFTRWTNSNEKDNVQSGLFIGSTPFKFWNYSAGTGFYTNNFMHVVGAAYDDWKVTDQASEFNNLGIYHTNVSANDEETYRVGAKQDILFGTKKNLYETYQGNHFLNAHIDDKKYDYGMWITDSPTALPSLWKSESKDYVQPWSSRKNNRGTLNGRSYIFGDFINHDSRINTSADNGSARKPMYSGFSLLELNSSAASYLYTGGGFVLHSTNSTGDGTSLGTFGGTNADENFGSDYWSTDKVAQHLGIDMISDSAPIMLSAIGATYDGDIGSTGLNYLYIQNGEGSALSTPYNEDNSGKMSWEIQGDFGSISARAFACNGITSSDAGFIEGHNTAYTSYGVLIEPGVVSPSGIFLESLASYRDWEGWEGMDWKGFSIYAQNGLCSAGNIAWYNRAYEGNSCRRTCIIYGDSGVVKTEGSITTQRELNAGTSVTASNGDITASNGNVNASGDVTANGTSLQTHTHSFSGTVSTTAPSYSISISSEAMQSSMSQSTKTYTRYQLDLFNDTGLGGTCYIYIDDNDGESNANFSSYASSDFAPSGKKLGSETMYNEATMNDMTYTVPSKTFTAYIEGETNQANGEGSGHVSCTLSL